MTKSATRPFISGDKAEVIAAMWAELAQSPAYPVFIGLILETCPELQLDEVVRLAWSTGAYHVMMAQEQGAIKTVTVTGPPENN